MINSDQLYEPLSSRVELDRIDVETDSADRVSCDPSDILLLGPLSSQDLQVSSRSTHNSIRFPKNNRLRARLEQHVGAKTWRFGLYAGLYACTAVLLTNIAFLLYGSLTHGGVKGSIATIMQGDKKPVSRLSTALHIFINILSTILLTSSNYAMQILCAPTRTEIDSAHANGNRLEIGVMSVRNLRHIKTQRVALWWVLAVSSLPLHVFYNSAVFQVTGGQDYSITAITELEEPTNDTAWERMSNREWTRVYGNEYVSGFTDLLLVLNNASARVNVHLDWSFSFDTPTSDACDWQKILDMKQISISTIPDSSGRSLIPARIDNYGISFPIENSTQYDFDIERQWPTFSEVKVPSRYLDRLSLCPESGWLAVPTNASLHVDYAFAKKRPYGSKIQVGLPFLAIVIVANIVKVVGILFTLRTCSSGHIITVGDAIATFLQDPEAATAGKCMHSRRELLNAGETFQIRPWAIQKKQIMSTLGGKRAWTSTNLMLSFIFATISLTLAFMRSGMPIVWGTASKLILPATVTSFDARGALLVTWLANLPQALLSIFYFSINRICTSICFAREWNSFATTRKGLRATSPIGDQRSTHFLQLPIRWAMPLTIASGLLHWLLSQSLFLVRREIRNSIGELYPESTCACGYSVLSLLVFTVVFCGTITTVGIVLMWSVTPQLPPARHCSLVISAACHPPPDDIGCHTKKVQWGVVKRGSQSNAGHCTYTSQPVEAPEVDCLYA